MKKLSLCLVFILALPLFLFGCNQESVRADSYKIYATFDEENRSLNCKQEVLYVNKSENSLNEICFFLYPNAFGQEQKVVSSSYLDKAYPNGKSYGGIEILNAAIENESAEFSISEQKNILTVNLNQQLYPNESISIDLEYCVNLATIRHRLGYYDDTANFGNFFPIACVYDDGFVKNEFSTNGDPFYSEISDFYAEISYPKEFVFASTGQFDEKIGEDDKTAICHAENVRDFCFVLSKKFNVVSDMAGDVKVNYYFYDDEKSEERLKTAVCAVKTFENLFGKYQYPELSVVKTGFCFGGMEYPNLVMIADDLKDEETQDYVIVHEIAHQWWYGMVGNNEFESSWVDEGLTEFSTALFYEKNEEYGLKYDEIMKNAMESYNHFVKVYKTIQENLDESMNRKLTEYATEPEYVNISYTKGMLMFDAIRNMMSDAKFFKCLKDYFKNYCFKNSSPEKLIKSFSNSAKMNLEGLFKAWIDGTVRIGG